MKKITIYDVAKEADVAISTVSKVLNQTGKISLNTKLKVERAIKKLNYKPRVVASAKQNIKTIGLLIPNIADPFMAEVSRTIEDHSRSFGYSVIICSIDNNADKELEYISILQNKYIDGIIIATGLKNNKALDKLKKSQIPFVVLAREIPDTVANTVVVNDYLGATEAVTYLINEGHEKIAIITEDTSFSATKDRLRGYKESMQNAELSLPNEYISIDNVTYLDAKKSAVEMLELTNPPSAIFATTEPLAIGAMQGIRESGYEIPENVSIIGFDNSILSVMCHPHLSTVSQPIEEMGKKIVHLLLDEINNVTKTKQHIVMTTKLIIRNSTLDKS